MSNPTTGRIYKQLCPPLPEEPDELANLRRVIAAAIASHVPKLEKLLGLQQPDSQFRHDLSRVILFCVLTNKFPPKRHSQNHKELKEISKDAALVEQINRRLISRLERTSAIYPPIKTQFLELGKQTADYASLTSMARGHANALMDKGGPRGMVAFRTLIEGLARAFESATGQTALVSYNMTLETYEGRFLDFVRAVVAVMRKEFPEITYPGTGLAVDIFVSKFTNSRRNDSSYKKGKNKQTARSSARRKGGKRV